MGLFEKPIVQYLAVFAMLAVGAWAGYNLLVALGFIQPLAVTKVPAEEVKEKTTLEEVTAKGGAITTVLFPSFKDTSKLTVSNISVRAYLAGTTGVTAFEGYAPGSVQMPCGVPIDIIVGDDKNYYKEIYEGVVIECAADGRASYFQSVVPEIRPVKKVGTFVTFNAGGYNESSVYNISASGLQQKITGVKIGVTNGHAVGTIIKLQGANIPVLTLDYQQVTGTYSPTKIDTTTISFGDVNIVDGDSVGNLIITYDQSAAQNIGSGSFKIVLDDLNGEQHNPYDGLGNGAQAQSITVQWTYS